jgi:hypothetical protein
MSREARLVASEAFLGDAVFRNAAETDHGVLDFHRGVPFRLIFCEKSRYFIYYLYENGSQINSMDNFLFNGARFRMVWRRHPAFVRRLPPAVLDKK